MPHYLTNFNEGKKMVTVKINDDDLLEMLVNRLDYWTDDSDIKDLYRKMYEHLIDGGCFEGAELNISLIVDNDYINYCTIIEDGDENYNKLIELYHNNEYDVSCNDVDCSFIEAVSDDETLILVRY